MTGQNMSGRVRMCQERNRMGQGRSGRVTVGQGMSGQVRTG